MPLRKKLRKIWHKTISLVYRAKSDTTVPEVSPFIRQSASSIPTPPELAPKAATLSTFEERTQIVEHFSVSQFSSRGDEGHLPANGSSGLFAGSHHVVFNHPVMGENQQLQLNYHGMSPVAGEGLRVRTQQDGSLSQTSSNQIGALERENADSPRAAGSSTFIAQTQNIHFLDDDKKRRQKVLRELKAHTIVGTEFNSAERDPPPRCHPGTRMSIREDLRVRIEDKVPAPKIIWIHGPAGVGKSAIMQTVVEEVTTRVTCATLFFSRPNRRHDARKAFTTLAYALAVANHDYCRYIGTRMENDPGCLTKSLDDQFKTLFITPFVENRVAAGSQRWVMFLDGLDECENTDNSDNQCRILKLIRDSTLRHAKLVPFIWVIASRPEANLKKAWSKIRERFKKRPSDVWELTIPVDSDQAARDVELYLHKEFETIRKKYSDLIPGHSHWPSDGDFVKIAKKSSGLFVFASTVVKYISHEDPVSRLEFIISLINQADQHPAAVGGEPFQMIDLLYSSIMSDVPKRLLPVAKSLLGFYHLSETIVERYSHSNLPPRFIRVCNILGFRQNDAYAALRKLQSVLEYPPPESAQEKGIRFFHASFSDFLLDPSRSQEYHVNLDQELTGIWRCYSKIIKQSITEGHVGVNISWPPDDNPSLLEGLQEVLLWQAEYNWARILINHCFTQLTKRRLQVDVTELTNVFQSLGLAMLAGDHFPVHKFLLWLDKHAPKVIQDLVVSRGFPLNQLDTSCLFKSLCITPRYRRATYSNVQQIDLTKSFENLDPSHWAQAKATLWTPSGEFCDLVQAFDTEGVHVTVFGMKPSESCAIIAPIRGSDSYEDTFYILPYSTA